MKRPNLDKVLVVAFIAPVVIATSAAHAEPLRPAGTYSEARVKGGEPARSSADGSLSSEVTSWMKSKWSGVKTSLGVDQKSASSVAGAKKPAPSRAPSAAGTSPQGKPEAHSQASSQLNQPSNGYASASQSASAPSQASSAMAVAIPSAPVGIPADQVPGVQRSSTGVAVYDVSSSDSIPRLDIGKEPKVSAADYRLDSRHQNVLDSRIVRQLETPENLSAADFRAKLAFRSGVAQDPAKVKDVVFLPKGKVDTRGVDRIVRNLLPERKLELAKYHEFTDEDIRLLSGLLLYQDQKCESAVGLFHKLSKAQKYQSEADYFLAMCSKRLGLETDFYDRVRRVLKSKDKYYGAKLLAEISHDVPYHMVDSFGQALARVAADPKVYSKLSDSTKANVAYILSDYGTSTGRFKTSLYWSKKVPSNHPKHLQARFMRALSEYQVGSKDMALKIQDELISDTKTDKAKKEFQALVALNVARMYFQERDFKNAHSSFLKVYKDHPLWFTSLNEMGWSQLMDGDYEGAIGNMYSVHSPYFTSVYKPESYVIRTIGYLNICQYGDAYKTLSMLEHEYRPTFEKMTNYTKRAKEKSAYYQTVRNYLTGSKEAKEVDGLPTNVIREMARHKDFTNLQKALNYQIDERPLYSKVDGVVEKDLSRSQYLVTSTRKRIEELRKNLGQITRNRDLEQHRNQWMAQLEGEIKALNKYFFEVDLYSEAKEAMTSYRKEVVGGADRRLAGIRTNLEKILATRLGRLKTDLERILDNNELLRYEVFAGSGENIRFQVAGGDVANRVPASIIPKSKSLQWEFDGEYWEDEIGHYRSSLKNNCPEKVRDQASLGGAQ